MEYSAHGITLTLQQWQCVLGIRWKTLHGRISRGHDIENSLSIDFVRKKIERKEDKIIKKKCLHCNHEFIIPKCRDWREHCCSSICKKEYRENKIAIAAESRRRNCKECNASFIARKWQIDNNIGIYCSTSCLIKNGVLEKSKLTPEAKIKRRLGVRKAMLEGRLVHKKGIENPLWKGGAKESRRRATEDGRMKARLKIYREKNKLKVKEWSQKRRHTKTSRLPSGSIEKKCNLQKWKCAICKCSVKKFFHVDHVIPISKGGAHDADNIQILCAKCNLRKSNKMPIEYMQSIGFLL